MDLSEINPIAAGMGILGGFIGAFVAKGMPGTGIVMKLFVFLVCAIGGYFISSKILD